MADDKLQAIFKKLDKDNSGGIDLAEATAGAKEFGAQGGHNASDEQIKAFFAVADKNKDGKIDFDEFKKIAGHIAAKHKKK